MDVAWCEELSPGSKMMIWKMLPSIFASIMHRIPKGANIYFRMMECAQIFKQMLINGGHYFLIFLVRLFCLESEIK